MFTRKLAAILGVILAVSSVAAFSAIATYSSPETELLDETNALASSEGQHFNLELKEDVNVKGAP
ncbi:MAG: hypothetical protein ACREA4_03105 [Nitrososphaera sp.]